jgi:2-polyprenyl-3-methyl-5-hydroxy-6-metoxy-1,4-benzoquinol methylase
MSIKSAAKPFVKKVVGLGLNCLTSNRRRKVKEHFELRFWDGLSRTISQMPDRTREQALVHERAHYEYFFTDCFGLSVRDYAGKRILDIGCGPMGSLEWANEASLRVGLDPLADHYRKLGLGTDLHQMTYVTALSEKIPFDDGFFDYVTTFNSLDHVEDVPATIRELKRVASPDARVLLMTEIEHLPTFTEPHRLDKDVVKLFEPEFVIDSCEIYGVRADHNLYASRLERIPHRAGQRGVLFAKLTRARGNAKA